MENEPGVIRDQMQDTRTALSEKLEALEQKVVTTVQDTTNTVTETVQSVKAAVEDTVGTVKDTVQATVDTLSTSVDKTVSAVKDSLDLSSHVDRHPWGMVLGSAAAGFLLGTLIPSSGQRRSSEGGRASSSNPFPESMARASAAPRETNGKHDTSEHASKEDDGMLSGLFSVYHDEIDKLKGLGISAVVGVVRDLVTQSVPGELGSRLQEWMNGLTETMGGKPLQEPLITPEPEPGSNPNPPAGAGNGSSKREPRGAGTYRR